MKQSFKVGGAVILAMVLAVGIRHLKTRSGTQSSSLNGGGETASNNWDSEDYKARISGKTRRDRNKDSASSDGGYNGRNYGRYIADRHLPLEELLLELEKLEKQLPREDFHRVMRMLAASPFYSPEEKAASFNEMMPMNGETFPVYQDTLVDWGLQSESVEGYFRFVGLLEAPEIRKSLAIGYLMTKCRSKETLKDLLVESADLSQSSFLGEGVQRRSASLKSIVDTMVVNKHIDREDAISLIRDLEVDEDFKNALLYRLGERESPYR